MQTLISIFKKAKTNNFYHSLIIIICLIIQRFCQKYLDEVIILNSKDKDFINPVNSYFSLKNSVTSDDLIEKQLLVTYANNSKFILSRRFAIFAEKYILPSNCHFSFARAYSVCSILKNILDLDYRIDGIRNANKTLNIACLGCRDSLEVSFARRFFKYNKFPNTRGIDLYSETNDVKIGDMLNLPIDNESIDIVISSHSLEHVSDYDLSIKEMRRVLKFDGYACIEVPTGWLENVSESSEIPVRSNDDVDLWDFVNASVTQKIFEKNNMDLIAKHESKSRKRTRLVFKKI